MTDPSPPILTNEVLFERARAVIPGGVNSPVRAFNSVGGTPYFVARAAGAHIWDVEGRGYVDMVQSYGAVIAGHAHPHVVDAVRRAAGEGTSYGAPTHREVLLAEAICARMPSVEKVRLVSSGTEATMTAIRLARGATGRSRIVKFAGNYHGHSDALLAAPGSAVAHLDHSDGATVPGSAGVPAGAVADTVVLPYNQVPVLDDTVACVIVEPVAANMGLVAPVPGFLQGLREECTRVGALLIFDEVITGFRLGIGGAQQMFGVTPDLTCMGKVIGGGLNVGAFGGRADVMDHLAPLGPVYQAGTLSGNPLATAAGLAALSLLDRTAYERLERAAARLAAGLQDAFDSAGVAARASRVGTLVGLFIANPDAAGPVEAPRDYDGARTVAEDLYGRFFHTMLDAGVALAPGAYEVLFPGLAHSHDIIDHVVSMAYRAANGLAGEVAVSAPKTDLGPLDAPLAATLDGLEASRAVSRLWNHDHTLWSPEPTEIVDRLGWLDVLDDMVSERGRIDDFVARLGRDGFTHCVLMGMGGSSLFPEVIARSFPTGPSGLELRVLDTTDPVAVARMAATVPHHQTLFLAASKSGGTIETRSHLEYFWDLVGDPSGFAVITDPGSDLAVLARDRGFRGVFENRADIGGRFSALSLFGIVPTAVAGVDWFALVERARDRLEALRSDDPAVNPGLWLGAVMGAAVAEGRDKLTLVLDPRIETFALWVEQLVAESVGKAGTGIVPVIDEPLGPPDAYGSDRLFVVVGTPDRPAGLSALAEAGHPVVHLPLDDPLDLGDQVLVWEVATALTASVLGVNAFDQPNVAEAKAATAAVLAGSADLPVSPPLAELMRTVRPGDYVSIQAYLDPEGEDYDSLDGVRLEMRDALAVAVTLSPGPRFLHSTGQLHKGGPPTGVFVQVVADDVYDVAVPGRAFGFGQLKRAQADGDLITLAAHGLRAGRYRVAELLAWCTDGSSSPR